MLQDVIRLPAPLEHSLKQIFPSAEERDSFVADAVEEALENYRNTHVQGATSAPASVGGTLHLFSDGGSRGNPGEAAIAYIIEDPSRGEVLTQGMQRIGHATNNIAEYQALILGLRAAQQFHPNRLICHLDSELVVRQLNGEYRVKMVSLQPSFEEAKRLAQDLPDVLFLHIPREDNYRADALVNRALDELPSPHKPLPAQRALPLESQAQQRPGDDYRAGLRRS